MEEKKNYSPWLHQLQRIRSVQPLEGDTQTHIAIIGGGIAGVSTAYFILRDTSFPVMLLEASKVAHGATGHNAGQVVSYFEKPFHEIVEEFGLEMARNGLEAVHSAWDLLDVIYTEAHIKTPLTKFTGYAGCTTLEQVLSHLKNNALRVRAGLPPHPTFVAEGAIDPNDLPTEFRKSFVWVKPEELQKLLETNDPHFIAALGSLKGCLNSAAFTEEVAHYLAQKYPDRFRLIEHTPVKTVRLHKDSVELVTDKGIVTAKRVILCTNGFEYIHIENKHGSDIDTKFHHMIRGSIGYMVAYLDPEDKPPSAISYFTLGSADKPTGTFDADPYFYLTRRLYYTEDGENPNLVCVGGPEQLVEDTTVYSEDHPFSPKAKEAIEAFLSKTYKHTPSKRTKEFLWHGLMGYTPNGIRRVGAEPLNPVLLYNLGCNGVGILPSIYGGKRIAQIIRGEKLAPSIFDVHHAYQQQEKNTAS